MTEEQDQRWPCPSGAWEGRKNGITPRVLIHYGFFPGSAHVYGAFPDSRGDPGCSAGTPCSVPAPSSLASDASRDPGAAWRSGRRPWMLLSVPSTPGSWDSALPPAGLLSQSLFPAPPCSRIPALAAPWEAAGPSIPARGGNRSPGSRPGVRSLPLGVPGFWLAQVVPPLVLSIRTIPRISWDSLPAFPGLRSAALALAGWHRRYSRGIFPTPLLAPCFRGVF